MIARAPFGRTGHLSSRAVFGAAALSRMRQERVDELLPMLGEFGVNHVDVAASYGEAELRLAPWLATNRDDVFLATKTGDRDGDGARASLERSLARLGADSVDLIQLHNLVERDEWDAAFAPGGAVAALARARDEGLTRFVGVTGHGLRIAAMHKRSLEHFDFDSVLLPYNHALSQDSDYRRDVDELFAVCAERDVAMQTIKSVARRRWQPATESPRYSWYEPLRDAGALTRAVDFVLAEPSLFLITSSDATLLRATLVAASADVHTRPSDAELAADRERLGIRPIFDGAEYERI